MLTELDIINAMLASTGTAPLTSNDTNHPLYKKALNKLTSVSRVIQGQGWWFNDVERTLTVDVSGEVIIPSTALHIDVVNTSRKLTVRGGKVYDLEAGNYSIGEDVKVAYVDLVPIADLPPTAWDYVSARAVYEFYRDEDGNQPKLGEYKASRDEAWVLFKQEHLKNADVNFFNGTSFQQMSRGVRTRRLPLSDT